MPNQTIHPGHRKPLGPSLMHKDLYQKEKLNCNKFSIHLCANWMAFPPTPVKQSIMMSPSQRSA